MGLTQTGTDGIKNDAITLAKQAAGTDGQIITYDASGNPVAVGPGTDGQVLTSTGAGSPPAFEDIPAKAALTGSTNNTITTVTGANAIQGEANLTFDGSDLALSRSDNAAGGISVTNTNDAQASGIAQLALSGGDNSYANISLEAGGNNHHIKNDNSGNFDILDGATSRLRIESNGRLLTGGITTDSGSFSSIVTTGGNNSNGGVQVHYNTGAYGGGSMTTANAAGGGLDFWTYTGNIGSESYSKRVSIDSGGHVTKPATPAFFAYHQSSDLTYDVGDTLAYPIEWFDIGSNYDTSTSTFTAPVAGRYLFSANANGDHDTGESGVPRAYWKINGSNVGNGVHLRGPDVTDQGLEQRSQTVIFNLAANDTVKIVVGQNRWDLFGANSFCGYLLG